MKVFVTGATGFIGSEVARRLRARGDHVRALVRNPAKAAELQAIGCELVAGELGDLAAIRFRATLSTRVTGTTSATCPTTTKPSTRRTRLPRTSSPGACRW